MSILSFQSVYSHLLKFRNAGDDTRIVFLATLMMMKMVTATVCHAMMVGAVVVEWNLIKHFS